jgi:hypothetical protein
MIDNVFIPHGMHAWKSFILSMERFWKKKMFFSLIGKTNVSATTMYALTTIVIIPFYSLNTLVSRMSPRKVKKIGRLVESVCPKIIRVENTVPRNQRYPNEKEVNLPLDYLMRSSCFFPVTG